MDAGLLRTIDVFLGGARQPLIVILGPTASGKTAISLEVANHVHGEPRKDASRPRGEVVNADSRQLYQYLDIGTAKITPEEMEGVPHHLLSVLDPRDEVTVGWYQREAMKVISDIHSRGTVPILVGGSMLYVSAITDGLSLAPPADPALRKRLLLAYDKDRGVTLYRRLQKIDPDAAACVHQRNRPRVVRAVEIYEVLHAPKSKAVSSRDELRPRDQSGKRSPYDLLIFGTECSGEELKRRIRVRVEEMFAGGWIEEVRGLLARGYTADDPGLKSHGYREIVQYLAELEASGSDADIDAMQEVLKRRIVSKTCQYAKRQLTWWRNDSRIRWIHV